MLATEGPCVTLAQHGVHEPRLVSPQPLSPVGRRGAPPGLSPASVACGGRGAAAEDPQPCVSTQYCVTWAVI